MAIPGFEIFRCYDDYGPIRVLEEGSKRYLAFGNDAEQSCVDLANPAKLVYEYTQAMAMTLLFVPSPARVTILGLGAGSLVHCLRNYAPSTRLDIVELRPCVAEVAQQWFGLSLSENDALIVDDAGHYMAKTNTFSDLILADVYDDNGMMDLQLSESFIEHCHQRLNDGGVLALNLWAQKKGGHPEAIHRINQLFGDKCMSCLVENGNLIVYAFKGKAPQLNPRRLQPLVKKLSKQLDVPVNKLLGRMKEV